MNRNAATILEFGPPDAIRRLAGERLRDEAEACLSSWASAKDIPALRSQVGRDLLAHWARLLRARPELVPPDLCAAVETAVQELAPEELLRLAEPVQLQGFDDALTALEEMTFDAGTPEEEAIAEDEALRLFNLLDEKELVLAAYSCLAGDGDCLAAIRNQVDNARGMWLARVGLFCPVQWYALQMEAGFRPDLLFGTPLACSTLKYEALLDQVAVAEGMLGDGEAPRQAVIRALWPGSAC